MRAVGLKFADLNLLSVGVISGPAKIFGEFKTETFQLLFPSSHSTLESSAWASQDFLSYKGKLLTLFHCSEGVEKCIPWSANITQQIDLAFNIFFMVYFFIRVSSFVGSAFPRCQSDVLLLVYCCQ